MPSSLPQPGSIWSVPKAGADALCIVLSAARGLSRGRPEHQVVPLYVPDVLVRIHSSADFLIRADESSFGFQCLAALWNLRPLLTDDLGAQVGTVTSAQALDDLRDAYLRLADASITVAEGRLGRANLDQAKRIWRAQEIAAWQQLSGRVFEDLAAQTVCVTYSLSREFSIALADVESLWATMLVSDDLLGSNLALEAVGQSKAVIGTYLSAIQGSPADEWMTLFARASNVATAGATMRIDLPQRGSVPTFSAASAAAA